MTKFSHLSEEKRDIIEYLINTKKTFTYIGEAIGVDRTTVSKEIKNNRYIKSNFYSKLDSKGIEKAISDCEQLKKNLMFAIHVKTKLVAISIIYTTNLKMHK